MWQFCKVLEGGTSPYRWKWQASAVAALLSFVLKVVHNMEKYWQYGHGID
jgi:hypothetical protein